MPKELRGVREEGEQFMRTTTRIRNLAFLGLLMTLVWAGPVNLRADSAVSSASSGGFFCGYGDCEITWTDCPGTWYWWSYPDGDAPPSPGDCTVKYEPSGEGCAVETSVDTTTRGNLYQWEGPEPQGSGVFWVCHQILPD
jgi:hypothetical protein